LQKRQKKVAAATLFGGLPPLRDERKSLGWPLPKGVPRVSIESDQAHRRAEALFKKEQQAHEGQEAMAEYRRQQDVIREKTARLRALRLTRDAAKNKS
jgi:hypothetical protein